MNTFAMPQPADTKYQFKGKTISIPAKYIIIVAYFLMIIPIIIFFVGWLKWYLAVLFSMILLSGTFWMIKKDYWGDTEKIRLPLFHLILIGGMLGLWIAFSGSCNVGAPVTNGDLIGRNALLRDLVEYSWPVYYPETDGYLCYYYIFWMIPALWGKVFGLSAAWLVQWIWILLILIVTFLLIVYLLKDYDIKSLWLISSFMILWSGMNLVGMMFCNIFGWANEISMSTMEGWCDAFGGNGEPFEFLYRSNQDTICQIYNQIIFWLAVPLFVQNRKIHNYAMLGLLVFPFSPWGTIGLGILMIIDTIHIFIIEKNPMRIIAEIFSVQNLCAIFSILVVFGSFFTSNPKTQSTSGGFGMLSLSKFDSVHIIEIVLFWLLEFGVYWLFIRADFKKDFLFKILLPVLMLIPLFWMGGPGSRDFCMDVSQPVLYILMIYMIKYVKDKVIGKPLILRNLVLIICLVSAACSPIFDFGLKSRVMYANKSLAVRNDWFYTFSNKYPEPNTSNQVVWDVEETIFFKHLTKNFEKISPVSESLSGINSIIDINEYFDFLAGKDCTLYIAVQDIQGYSLRQETVDKITQLGFDNRLNILMQHEYHSFIGIVRNGEIVMEQIGGDELISYSSELDGYPVTMESATLNTGNFSTINIRGKDYSVKGRGLNIAVRDNLTGCVIDSVAFDTHVDEIPCTRNWEGLS